MPHDRQAASILQRLGQYEAENRATKPLYDEWAHTYEDDLLVKLGYSAHRIASQALATLLDDRTASIIDIGCGTGLVGQELARLGFAVMDGIDISPDMLVHARAKAIYRNLMTGDLNARTAIAGASYDALICAGSFAPGHLGPEAFPEFIRLVKPGGTLVIFMNGVHFVKDGYEEHLRKLEAEGKWKINGIKAFNYMTALDRPGRLITTGKC